MTLEIRPLGTACNLACTYCYQEPVRQNTKSNKYDIDKIIEAALKRNEPFNLFGGEALLTPKKDLERLFKITYERYGHGGIQTNGTLIDDDHIDMFHKYNISVGISIDGPNELNELREARVKKDIEEKTLKETNKIMSNIEKLRGQGIDVSVIITLHRANCSEDRISRLFNFIEWLGSIGVKSGNIHPLEVDKTMRDQEKNVLSSEENRDIYIKFMEFFEERTDLNYAPFATAKKAMELSSNGEMCNWNFCDVMNTSAVYGIEGDGSVSNCGRTNKDGIELLKTEDMGYERYISLYHSPKEANGCNGCRFFIMCGGSCPGESIDYDFRNKTIHCESNYAMFSYYENQLIEKGITPITKRHDLKLIEFLALNELKQGRRPSINNILERAKNENMFLFNAEVR